MKAAIQPQAADAPGGKPATSGENLAVTTVVDSPERPLHGRWITVAAHVLLPALVLMLALVAGYAKWVDTSIRNSETAAAEALRSATEGTVAMLSYTPDNAATELNAALNRMTGPFKDSYSSLVNDVVVPGSLQKHITAQARVVAAAPVSSSADEAVIIVFVNQTVTVGGDAPTETASSVRITLDRVGDQWLIRQFDPV